MKNDPTIQRIRDARHKISEQFDHDPKRLVAYYIECQQKQTDRILKTEPNKSGQ